MSSVDRVTTETRSFVLVTANFVAPVAAEITQSSDQVRIRLISQLIRNISRVLQKLLQYFDGTSISYLNLPPVVLLTVIFAINLKDSESVILSFVILP